jgi:hypothetical protein
MIEDLIHGSPKVNHPDLLERKVTVKCNRQVIPTSVVLLAALAMALGPERAAAAVMTKGIPWPDGRVTYYLDVDGTQGPVHCKQTSNVSAGGDPLSAAERHNVQLAIQRYHDFTPLRFDLASDLSDPDTVIFTKRTRNQSAHANTSGKPDRADPNSGYFHTSSHPCVFFKGNSSNGDAQDTSADAIEHELGHTIGMPHEQKRPDRGQYVKVNEDCIEDDGDAAFEKIGDVAMSGPYDYDSIMQYPSTSKRCSVCPAACVGSKLPLVRRCTITNPYYAGGTTGCIEEIEDNDDFSRGDINVMYRRYERALDANESGDRLGAAMAAGDFDGDGYLDLAVGAPGETRLVNGISTRTGVVYLWRGTSERLVAWKQVYSQTGNDNARFGEALAAGDLDDDGADELVVGAPGERGPAGSIDGQVHIFRVVDTYEIGDTNPLKMSRVRFGLGVTPWKTINHLTLGLSAQGAELGASLTIGNFDGSGTVDLAIGAPAGGLAGTAAGYVAVVTGFMPGTTMRWQLLSQVNLSIERAGERFGEALAAAQLGLTSTAPATLVVGAPEPAVIGRVAPTGAAYVFAGGASMAAIQELRPATATPNRFGAALAIARTSQGPAIAIGSPDEDGARGRVYVYRTSSALTPFPLALAGTLAHPTGTAVAGDHLGDVLAAVRVSGMATDTLIAGLPLRDAPGATDSGAYVRFMSATTSVPLEPQGTMVDNPSPGTGKRFGSSAAVVGVYDPLLGAHLEDRVAVGAEGWGGGVRVRDGSGGWDLFDQSIAHPE